MKKNITFHLDVELIEKLREYSDESMIPQARIVAAALEEYLEKQKQQS